MNLPINQIVCGDCLEVMKDYPDNSFDACITDPPYKLGFMDEVWDKSGITYKVVLWREVLRILKPGGHLLSFGGSRTYHRMVCAIEDAGFEIRDMVEWIYGSGFPKSLDISKAIDKQAGMKRKIIGRRTDRAATLKCDIRGNRLIGRDRPLIDLSAITRPVMPEAKQWEGWGTALKPAHEPICLARKPLSEKTVARNILKWGTGGINIDDCRIPIDIKKSSSNFKNTPYGTDDFSLPLSPQKTNKRPVDNYHLLSRQHNYQDRFPANLIHDGSAEVLEIFPDARGQQGCTNDNQRTKVNYYDKFSKNGNYQYEPRDDSGSVARFFYCAKVSKGEREAGLEKTKLKQRGQRYGSMTGTSKHAPHKNEPQHNNHPTVKPLTLMSYLLKLITPPDGIVLDMFAGSGSTLMAAKWLGYRFVGIEISKNYCKIARQRLNFINTISLMKAVRDFSLVART